MQIRLSFLHQLHVHTNVFCLLLHILLCDMGVDVHCSREIGMPHDLLNEFNIVGAFAEPGTEGVPQVVNTKMREHLIYLFDMFGDRAYFLELTGTFEAEKGASYPREIYAQAAAPDQYDPSKTRAEDDDGSIFGEVMSEFSDFEGDDNYDDEY